MRKKYWLPVYLALLLFLFYSIMAATAIGSVPIPVKDTVRVILSRFISLETSDISRNTVSIIWNLRLPRVLLAALIGASLALSGVSFQGLLRNPLADPYTIGVSSGAAVGATAAMFLRQLTGLNFPQMIPLFAMAGAFAALFFIYNMAKIGGKVPVVTLILGGVVVSSFLSAIISLLMVLSGENMHGIYFWLSGGLILRSWPQLWFVLPYLILGFIVLFFYARELNVLLMGEEVALTLGINVERTKKVLLFVASVVTAAAVSVSGMIGFIGLIIPHAVRIITGPDHRVLLPASALVGASFLVWSDVAARTVLAPQELPVGIITAFVGAPFFIYLLRKKKREISL
jgi:iron complex transport system permease protein